MSLNDIVLTFLIKNKLRGKDRLYRLLVRLGFGRSVLAKAKFGIKLLLSPNEYIDNIIVAEGFYESEVTEEILKTLKDGDTFWDIGANIGIHSLAVKKTLPNANVCCFEPNPKSLVSLCDNVRLNKLDIHVCGFALFDKEAPMTLYTVKGNSGMSTLTPCPGFKFSATVQCLTTTGDILLSKGYAIPNVIKLDTEGSELSILKGCKNILVSPYLKKIVFEGGNDLLKNLETDGIVLFLKEFGFNKITLLLRRERTHHNLSNFAVSKEG